jgi:asparagine synthase (glutamine-hydrolysing)
MGIAVGGVRAAHYTAAMCGIAGFLDLKRQTGADELAAAAIGMADALIHRGPDSSGVWCDEATGVALAFRRLAIIDTSAAGNQPMRSGNGRYILIYNGEIYNFRELRRELEETGVAFRGDADSEVLLEGIAAWGVAATLTRLIGMFAFAVWDREQRELWLARDRLGIKPLYYGLCGGLFLFGSELKALRAKDGWRPRLDRDALAGFARFNYVPAPRSIYTGIHKLEAGAYLRYRPGDTPQIQRYWDMAAVAAQPRRKICDADAIDEAEALIGDAVRRRMVADVPLGALLSGGVDSATVVALMQQASTRPVRTFTIGFSQSDFDESGPARAVAAHLGTDHTEIMLTARDARGLIPDLADCYDEPFADSSALPTRLVSAMARRDVTVALSGDGGDETFLGYNRYRAAPAAWRRAQRLPVVLRRAAASTLQGVSTRQWDRLARLLPAGLRPALVGDKLHKLAALLGAADCDAVYKQLVSHWRDPQALVPGGRDTPAPVWEASRRIDDFAERMAFLDTTTYLPDDILTKLDRASMSVGLETRVPLLDHRVVEFAWSLPRHLRLRGGESKWLLRQVLYRHVPRALIERPKAGFAVPVAAWLRGPLRDWAEDFLDERRLRADGLFDPAPVRAAWADHLAGRGNHWQGLWGVCMAQAWHARWGAGLSR